MYFTKATVLALVAATSAALSSPILETRQNGVTCQTSSGSPTTDDVTDVINQLRGQGGNCPQTNGEASGKPSHFISLSPHHRENQEMLKKVSWYRLYYASQPQQRCHLRLWRSRRRYFRHIML